MIEEIANKEFERIVDEFVEHQKEEKQLKRAKNVAWISTGLLTVLMTIYFHFS